ncbi:MAG: helix-turn-helix transcriptional regulator [Alphaproteobacteria bacterium]|nr:transcriptional regulator [Rhodobiaceae bacterium]MBO6541773.1 helix-turn-helix transcriptional regulator [Alphaproteobacteria bacterium]MBO6629753.1 helix-turn-helix transcriptional regulator [Alphaproteobacteria bacterium]MDF1625967.1 helix-turn-helix domain-containing protein [Parvibaculaceae bacterium]
MRKADSPSHAPTQPGSSPLFRAFRILGDGWTFFILREAFFGVRRFEDFLQALAIPRARLTERLSWLVEEGVLRKRPYSDRPVRFEYLLSERGHDVYSMTLMMKDWGDRWRRSKPRPSLQLIHRSCGKRLHPKLVCSACAQPFGLDDLEWRPLATTAPPPQFEVRRQLMTSAFERDTRNDSVARTLAVIGDQWTMMILKEAFQGAEHFETWQSRLAIARSTLSSRLKHLTDEAVFEKVLYQTHPPRYAYRLTAAGKDLFRVGILMLSWGERWLNAAGTPPSCLHKQCGKPLIPMVICACCEAQVFSHDVTFSHKAGRGAK